MIIRGESRRLERLYTYCRVSKYILNFRRVMVGSPFLGLGGVSLRPVDTSGMQGIEASGID
jgi:hypothetical protein